MAKFRKVFFLLAVVLLAIKECASVPHPPPDSTTMQVTLRVTGPEESSTSMTVGGESSSGADMEEDGDDEEPSGNEIECVAIFSAPENVQKEKDSLDGCLDENQITKKERENSEDLEPMTTTEYPWPLVQSGMTNCFLSDDPSKEEACMAQQYWQSLDQPTMDTLVTCFATKMEWLTEDGKINKEGIAKQLEPANGTVNATLVEEIRKAVMEECVEVEGGVQEKLSQYVQCAYSVCFDDEESEDEE
jgi:hypothetical protein